MIRIKIGLDGWIPNEPGRGVYTGILEGVTLYDGLESLVQNQADPSRDRTGHFAHRWNGIFFRLLLRFYIEIEPFVHRIFTLTF